MKPIPILALIRACSNKTNIAATHKPTKQAAVTVCPTLSRAIISPFHWHFLSFRTGYLAPKTIISCHDIAQYCQQFFSPDNPVRAFQAMFPDMAFFPYANTYYRLLFNTFGQTEAFLRLFLQIKLYYTFILNLMFNLTLVYLLEY